MGAGGFAGVAGWVGARGRTNFTFEGEEGMERRPATPTKRRYPQLYERLIPIALVVLVLSMVFLSVASIAVIFGWIAR